jgi:hypothetical protein
MKKNKGSKMGHTKKKIKKKKKIVEKHVPNQAKEFLRISCVQRRFVPR